MNTIFQGTEIFLKRLLLTWTLWGKYIHISSPSNKKYLWSFLQSKQLVHIICLFYASMQSKFYLGDVGNGAAMKLVVNMIMGRSFKTRLLLFGYYLTLCWWLWLTLFLSIFSILHWLKVWWRPFLKVYFSARKLGSIQKYLWRYSVIR